MARQADGVSIADRAFALALATWGETADDALWARFGDERRDALQRGVTGGGADDALNTLRREHAAQARPDLARVHPSWCLRGLRAETPAVQRAAVERAPEPLRATLRAGLGFAPHDVQPPLLPAPAALAWAAALWSERLVGDVAERADDPPVIRLLTAGSFRASVRRLRAVGLAKWSASRAEPPASAPRGRARFDALRAALRALPSRAQDLADRDVAAALRQPRHRLLWLGSLTAARLLSLADPYRVRWTLQHVPYAAAKALRGLMPPPARGGAAWANWEREIFLAASAQVHTSESQP